MISVNELLYELDLRQNKVATNEHQSIPVEDKIFALNSAQNKLIKKKISTNNVYQLGLDSFKKRYEDLQGLIIQSESVDKLKKVKKDYTSFTFNVSKLENKYLFPIAISAECTKGECTDRIISVSKIIDHSDLSTMMNNSNYIPSFEYQESLGLIAENVVHIYTDETFNIDKVYFSYIRYPKKIDIEGYIDLNNNPSITQDCELNDYLIDELLDLAALELAISTENTPAINTADIRLKNNE